MKSLRSLCLATALVLGLLAQAGAAWSAGVETISLAQLNKLIAQGKGNVVVVNFWATWCGPCRMEMPGLIQLRKAYGEKDVRLYGVSLDLGPRPVETFLQQNKLNYPIYLATSDVGPGFQVQAIPRTVIYDRKGGVAAVQDGYMPFEHLKKAVDAALKK